MSDESLDDIIADLDRTIAEGPAAREVEGDGDGGKAIEPADDTAVTTRAGTSGTSASKTGGPRRRLVGLLAMILGAAGCLLSLVFAFLMLRTFFGATAAVEDLMQPVDEAVERLEDRIDETDDVLAIAVSDPERVGELRARVDGLVDLSTGARRSLDAVDGHPLYGLLPAGTGDLDASLTSFEESAADLDTRLGSAGSGDELSPAATSAMTERVNGMQTRVSDARDQVDDAVSSLVGWARLGLLAGFLGSLWSLWAQIGLARRGWRGFRGRSI